MSAAAKKKQDEKNTKILRELVSLPGNKHCFDCSQRGPTYVNMTIGSFICTGCSGVLRGLNPPHRVKSISMASFTPDEMEFLKSRGNDHCRRVWLGLHDRQAGMPPEPDSRSNEQAVRDFMAIKYEKKRYYVPPSEELFAEARAVNQPVFDRIEKGQGAKGARSILGINAPPSATAAKLAGPPAAPASSASSATTARPAAPASSSASIGGGMVPPLPVAPATSSAAAQPPAAVSASTTADLLGADLFGSSNGTAAPSADGGFANFDSLASGGVGVGRNSSATTNFFGSGGVTAPALVSSSFGAPLQPMSSSSSGGGMAAATAPSSTAGTADKYAAFAELFNSAPTGLSAFSSGASNQPAMVPASGPIDWTGGGGGGGGSGGGGINWGNNSATTTSAPTSTAPWSSAQQPPSWDASMSGGMGVPSSQSWNAGWGGGLGVGGGSGSGGMWAAAPPATTAAANPFNPFGVGGGGGSGGFGGMQQPQQPVANPFFGGGFGAQPFYQQQQQQQPPPPSAGTNPFL